MDDRSWWGVPNTLDVLSNLPLVLAGAAGSWSLQGRTLNLPKRNALHVFFAGLILCGLGSATYHWAPDASSLVMDRLGMAVAFAGVLAVLVAESVGQREARLFLPAVLVLAVFRAAGEWVSGHNLKHAAAACAAFLILVGVGRHRLGDNALVPPSAMA